MIMILRRFVVVMMPVSMVIVTMGRRRHPQAHLVRPIFPVQVRVLRRSPGALDRKGNPHFDQDIPGNSAFMLTTPGEPVKPPLETYSPRQVFQHFGRPVRLRVRSMRFPEPRWVGSQPLPNQGSLAASSSDRR